MSISSWEFAARQFETTTVQQLPMPELAQELIGPQYKARPHTDLLHQRLTQAVIDAENGIDTQLVVNMPPGLGKSQTCSVLFPTYVLGQHPDWEIGLISAEQSLALKFSRDVMRNYQEHIRPIPHDAVRNASEWTTSRDTAGGMIARGISGALSGRRLRVAIIDDPIRHQADALSPKVKDRVWDTWQKVVKPRMRMNGSIVLVVQTRWVEDDLAGKLIDDGWETINLPALAETEDDALGRSPGEPLLTPQRDETTEEALQRWEHIKHEVGSRTWSALYMGRPAPDEGLIFNPAWFQYWDKLPEGGRVITSWDLALSGTNDYVVGQRWMIKGPNRYLLDQVRGQWTFTETLEQMTRFCAGTHEHLVEQAANGHAAIDVLRKQVPGIIPIKPRESKEVRALAVTPEIESGNVYLPDPANNRWVSYLMDEIRSFPAVAHDDQVDAMTQALNRLRTSANVRLVDNSTSVIQSEW